MITGIELIQAERKRQIEKEGYLPEEDARHTRGELQRAAKCYLFAAFDRHKEQPPAEWPWDVEWWKPTTPRRMLEKAGALFLAEVDRLRLLQKAKPFAEPETVFTILANFVDTCAQKIDAILEEDREL